MTAMEPRSSQIQELGVRLMPLLAASLLFCVAVLVPQQSWAQFNLFGQEESVTISAEFHPVGQGRQAVLEVTAKMAPGYHIYSMTQKAGKPSMIFITKKDIKRLGNWVPDRAPELHEATVDIPYETEVFEDQVVWQALIEFPEGTDLKKARVPLKYDGLACDAQFCKPYETETTARAGKALDAVPAALVVEAVEQEETAVEEASALLPKGEARIEAGRVTLSGWLNVKSLKPGDKAKVFIKAEIEPGYHTYSSLPPNEDGEAYSPSYMGVIGVSGTEKKVADFQFADPVADRAPHLGIFDVPEYEDSVVWEMEFTVPENPGAELLVLHGVMQSQACNEGSCDAPYQVQWHLPLKVADKTQAGKSPLIWVSLDSQARELLLDADKAKAFLDGLQSPDVTEQIQDHAAATGQFAGGERYDLKQVVAQPFHSSSYSLPAILGIALLGGFILNFMPCVLPVIGLKILSLVEQAGESRAKAISFNGIYVLGMLSVFWTLALLISTKEFGWGSQFSSTLFNITFAAIVFAMALSYLEIWEITLPSFVGVQSSKLDQKDGVLGTFFKGVITTVLATPCSGPGLATALAWCADKPTSMIFLVFTFLGIGMGLPYLLVALYPPLISFLPKPGPWMNTFKQVMGFVLLGTVAFFMSYVDLEYLFPLICFLMVVWFACWLVGRLTFSSTVSTWMKTWAASLAILAASSYFIFGWQVSDQMNDLLGGNFNDRFKSDWNLLAAQEYRVNNFVASKLNENQDLGLSAGTMLATNQPAGAPAVTQTVEHGGVTWVPYSLQALEHYVNGENPKTVFVDFTADWCVNCKAFERTVLHREDISRRLGSEEVIAMIADKTHTNKEIDDMLKKLGSGNQIPLYAIFSKDDPYRPITLDGSSISIANVTAALDKLGVPGAEAISDAPPAVQMADAELAEEDGLPIPPQSVSKLNPSNDGAL